MNKLWQHVRTNIVDRPKLPPLLQEGAAPCPPYGATALWGFVSVKQIGCAKDEHICLYWIKKTRHRCQLKLRLHLHLCKIHENRINARRCWSQNCSCAKKHIDANWYKDCISGLGLSLTARAHLLNPSITSALHKAATGGKLGELTNHLC